MKHLAAAALVALAAGGAADAARVTARVLGVAQDGGLPHLGCAKRCCERARKNPALAVRVASLALVHETDGAGRMVFLIDATPDFRSQVDSALGEAARQAREPGDPLDGIFLTHAHIGHYTGLMYLGRESMSATRVPVWATSRMAGFLSANGPWKRLVDGGNVDLRTLRPGGPINLAAGLSVEALRVAHREEESDAVGFLVTGPARRLLYIPDIDAWERWDRDITALVRSVDVALLDGTFFSPADLGTRSAAEIPHPFMLDSMERLAPTVGDGKRVIFIHLNHSNPALQPGSPERERIERGGFEVATDGMELEL